MESSIENSLPDAWDPGSEEESVRSGVRFARALADEFGIPLITYEAGQHLVPQPPMRESDQTIMLEKAIEANTSPRMADLYQL